MKVKRPSSTSLEWAQMAPKPPKAREIGVVDVNHTPLIPLPPLSLTPSTLGCLSRKRKTKEKILQLHLSANTSTHDTQTCTCLDFSKTGMTLTHAHRTQAKKVGWSRPPYAPLRQRKSTMGLSPKKKRHQKTPKETLYTQRERTDRQTEGRTNKTDRQTDRTDLR